MQSHHHPSDRFKEPQVPSGGRASAKVSSGQKWKYISSFPRSKDMPTDQNKSSSKKEWQLNNMRNVSGSGLQEKILQTCINVDKLFPHKYTRPNNEVSKANQGQTGTSKMSFLASPAVVNFLEFSI